MKLTITVDDKTVYKDGLAFRDLDFTAPVSIHALQWNIDNGWIEYNNESEFKKQPNETITVLPSWAANALSKWEEKKVFEDSLKPQPIADGVQTL